MIFFAAWIGVCIGFAACLLWVNTWERRRTDRTGRAMLEAVDERAAFRYHEDV